MYCRKFSKYLRQEYIISIIIHLLSSIGSSVDVGFQKVLTVVYELKRDHFHNQNNNKRQHFQPYCSYVYQKQNDNKKVLLQFFDANPYLEHISLCH